MASDGRGRSARCRSPRRRGGRRGSGRSREGAGVAGRRRWKSPVKLVRQTPSGSRCRRRRSRCRRPRATMMRMSKARNARRVAMAPDPSSPRPIQHRRARARQQMRAFMVYAPGRGGLISGRRAPEPREPGTDDAERTDLGGGGASRGWRSSSRRSISGCRCARAGGAGGLAVAGPLRDDRGGAGAAGADAGLRLGRAGARLGRLDWRAILGAAAATGDAAGLLVWWLVPGQALALPRRATGLWLAILLLYPVLSALPQELIFRALFFRRYRRLFPASGGRGGERRGLRAGAPDVLELGGAGADIRRRG